jgi:prevent-host-death family protein
MAEIGITELKSDMSRVVGEVAAGRVYVITKSGRPTAVLMPIEEAEDHVFANAEEFISMRRRAREAYRRGQSKALQDIA